MCAAFGPWRVLKNMRDGLSAHSGNDHGVCRSASRQSVAQDKADLSLKSLGGGGSPGRSQRPFVDVRGGHIRGDALLQQIYGQIPVICSYVGN